MTDTSETESADQSEKFSTPVSGKATHLFARPPDVSEISSAVR
jgi:hypothetical protein